MVQRNLSPWSVSSAKRLFDVVCGVPLLLAFMPLMAVIAAAVKLSSPGPVLFRQTRIGKDGACFEILKFRSMADKSDAGPRLTQRTDQRITKLGRLLRSCKLDELPQLWNVLRGDMSLVGPRPDLPEYCRNLETEQEQVLRLRPGVTSPASLRFSHEEDLLATVSAEELTSYYSTVVLPEKIRLDLEYAQRATLRSDLGVLIRTSLTTLPRMWQEHDVKHQSKVRQAERAG
jgi:lipopolysaccharide/colanic/teichoic acid biosynthesis glycosyltransferase